MKHNLKRILPIFLAIVVILSVAWYLFSYDPEFTRDMLLEQRAQPGAGERTEGREDTSLPVHLAVPDEAGGRGYRPQAGGELIGACRHQR